MIWDITIKEVISSKYDVFENLVFITKTFIGAGLKKIFQIWGGFEWEGPPP